MKANKVFIKVIFKARFLYHEKKSNTMKENILLSYFVNLHIKTGVFSSKKRCNKDLRLHVYVNRGLISFPSVKKKIRLIYRKRIMCSYKIFKLY